MSIAEYTLVSVEGSPAFIKEVNEMIQEGWTPHGGAVVTIIPTPEGRDEVFSQAMVKYDPIDTGF